MGDILNWWCSLFGYSGCNALSVFEAIILTLVSIFLWVAIASVAMVVLVGICAFISEVFSREVALWRKGHDDDRNSA
jgi:uncharacterized membrane protein HdeD (DUF308 family)